MVPFLSAAWLVLSAGVAGQDASQGWIEGKVLGEALAPVPGVLVEASGGALTTPLQVITNREGAFRIGPVPAGGGYRIRALHPGYRSAIVEDAEVGAGETLAVELRIFRLTVALDTIQALGAPLRIRREDTGFGTRVDTRAIELLPTPHEPTALVALTPGSRPGQIWGGAARQANIYQLDGAGQTHPGTGGAMIEPSMRWVERLEVGGLGAAAEYGNFQGGLVNVVTRSGSNRRERGFRIGYETGSLNASNLEPGEIGVETILRREVEGEVSGPILRDRLYYFAGGHLLQERRRAQSHLLPPREDRFLPWTRDRSELRGLGKLRWEPSYRNRLDLSGGWIDSSIDNATFRGFETPEAAGDLASPAGFYALSWNRAAGGRALEAKLAGFRNDERQQGAGGADAPGVRIFAHGDPPTPTYSNSPFSRRRSATSTAASLAWDVPVTLRNREHRFKVGAEASFGSHTDQRLRNGGMTWRPVRSSAFDPHDPSTWYAGGSLPVDRGGNVELHSRVRSQSIYVQDHITISPRLTLSPGLRFGRWSGDLLPKGEADRRFSALEATGLDPRFGVTLDPLGTNRWVVKGHWGRFHQGMLAQFFDRVEGGEVFDDRESWYYRGPPPEDPSVPLDAGRFPGEELSLYRHFRMNETGRVDPRYRHPYVDQWVVGFEASPTERLRAELVYVNRTNRNMVALVDRNLADNYHVYRDVSVTGPEGAPVHFMGGSMVLPEIYIPYDALRAYILHFAETGNGNLPPGFSVADLEWMTFDRDLVLTNPEEAERRFDQLQFALHTASPRWGASASVVWTRLRGNLDMVTGYEAGTDFDAFAELGAGPFVRPNEQVNFQGTLAGFAPLELKLAAHGALGLGIRAGAFLHAARGDRLTAYLPLDAPGTEYYTDEGERIDNALLYNVAGERIRLQERGAGRYDDRSSLDLRFDRTVPFAGERLRATVDVFNVWNSDSITRIVRESGPGSTLAATSSFGAVQERVPPRTFRLGLTADF